MYITIKGVSWNPLPHFYCWDGWTRNARSILSRTSSSNNLLFLVDSALAGATRRPCIINAMIKVSWSKRPPTSSSRVITESFKDQRWAWEESVRAEKSDRDAEREKETFRRQRHHQSDIRLMMALTPKRLFLSLCISDWWWRWRRNVSFSLSASLSLFSALTVSSHAHLWSLKLSLKMRVSSNELFSTLKSYHRVYPSSSLGGDRTPPESIHSRRVFPFRCLCQQPLCQVHFVRAFWTKTLCPRVELQCRLMTNSPPTKKNLLVLSCSSKHKLFTVWLGYQASFFDQTSWISDVCTVVGMYLYVLWTWESIWRWMWALLCACLVWRQERTKVAGGTWRETDGEGDFREKERKRERERERWEVKRQRERPRSVGRKRERHWVSVREGKEARKEIRKWERKRRDNFGEK